MSGRGRKADTRHDAEVRDLVSRGFSQSEIAKHLLIDATTAFRIVKRLGLKARDARGDKLRGTNNHARAIAIAQRYAAGETLQAIAEDHGVSRERVRQIIRDQTSLTPKDGGQAVRSRLKRAEQATKKDQQYMARLGCGWDEYKRIRQIGWDMRAAGRGHYQAPLGAFCSQRNNAQQRGIGWELSFWQWWAIWQASGRWEQRGRGQGFAMCRKGDVGPYAVGNVFIATNAENIATSKIKKSGLPIGVRATKSGRFVAHRSIKGRRICLGTYSTAKEAFAAYVAAAPGFIPHRSTYRVGASA